MNTIRKQVMTALAAIFLTHGAAMGQAQDFWQQFGRALQDARQNQNRRPQQPPAAGNWFKVTPKYRVGYDDYEEPIRIRDGYQVTPNVPNMIVDGLNAIESLRQPQQPRPPQGSRPRTPPAQTVRRTTPATSPPTRAPVPSQTPPRNSPTAQDTTARNQDPNQLAAISLPLTGVAEADARQAVEAATAGGMLDVSVEGHLQNKLASGDPRARQALKEWHEMLVKEVRADDIAQFREKHAGLLDPQMQDTLELREKLARYGEHLASGALTAAGKDQALIDIQNSLDKLKSHPTTHPQFAQTLGQHVTSMQQLNDLGKLAELSGGTPKPLQTMLVGISSTGVPVTVLGDMIGLPVIQSEPVKDATTPRLTRGAILRNLAENGQTVKYLLNSHPCTMEPGERQVLEHKYTLNFDPGDGTSKRHALEDGVYHWVLDGGRWDIERVTVTVTIDNSASNADFHYLANGKEATVRAGERASHSDDFLVEVTFDPGSGGSPCRKLLASGVYTIGVDPARGCFDLYAADERPAVASREQAESPAPGASSGENSVSRQGRIEELLKQMRSRSSSG